MRKLIIILFILIIGFYSYGQDIRGSRGIFGTVYIGSNSSYGRWIDSVRNDTTGWLGRTRSIGTLDAIYSFVAGRVGAGGGGGTWGSITGTLSNQTDLQNALNLKATLASPTFTGTVIMPTPFTLGATSVTATGTQLNYLNAATGTTGTASTNLVYSTSPLFTTPRLSSTSTINYVWTATDGSGNGSFQAIPSDNLIVVNAGSGIQSWFTSGDSLYLKRFKNTSTISWATDTDSSMLGTVIDASITYAKIQNVTQARLLGRYTASNGVAQEISIGSGLALDAGTGVLSATGGTGITIGATTITSGTNTRVLYNNSGVVGEYTVTGSGTTIPLSTSPDFTTGITIGSVAVPTISSTSTLTNKRITPRYGSTASSATPTINTDNVDVYELTAQAEDITSFTTNLSGTPTVDQTLHIIIVGTAARAITWGASFEASSISLPTTTVSTNRLDVFFTWNSTTSKWRCGGSW